MKAKPIEEDRRFMKSPCTECGELCYHLCYFKSKTRERLVCVDCFGKRCEQLKQEREKEHA